MAFITYLDQNLLPEEHQVADDDNILRIHGVNSQVIPDHFNLYKTLMFGKGPLSRIQREMIAVLVSGLNECEY